MSKKDQREKIRENINFIKLSDELKHYKIFNNDYTKLTNKLKIINSKVDGLVGNSTLNADALFDELKFSVIYNHFKTAEEGAFNPISLASIGDWCGAGTPVYSNLMGETPEGLANSYKIDLICRQHDINYLHAKGREDVHKADIEMLLSLLDTFVLRGTKQVVYDVYSGNIEQFKNYIFSSLNKLVEKPEQFMEDVVGGAYSGAYNVMTSAKALDLITGGKYSLLNLSMGYNLIRERVLGMVAFGGIGMKLLYDLALGKNIYMDENGEYTNSVYGWEKTRFKLEDVDYIVKDIEALENQRLDEAGFDSINFNELLAFDDNELKEVLTYEEEVEDVSEYEEEYVSESDEEYDTDLIDIIDPREQDYINELLDILKVQ
jgi:hypothetical protein